MAALAHLGVGLAAKQIAPEISAGYLVLGAYLLDLLWLAFYLAGLAQHPKRDFMSRTHWRDVRARSFQPLGGGLPYSPYDGRKYPGSRAAAVVRWSDASGAGFVPHEARSEHRRIRRVGAGNCHLCFRAKKAEAEAGEWRSSRNLI